MERAGLDFRYDARTLKKQGIDRTPQIHVGPKAETLNQKGYRFESKDRLRGERAIIYSLFDQDSRARHNANIIEANRHRQHGEPATAKDSRRDLPRYPINPHDKERRDLQEAQSESRHAMYQERQRDRSALRQAQQFEKQRHQVWARQLYAEARQTAYQRSRTSLPRNGERSGGSRHSRTARKPPPLLSLNRRPPVRAGASSKSPKPSAEGRSLESHAGRTGKGTARSSLPAPE
jgi:hypothetical protein